MQIGHERSHLSPSKVLEDKLVIKFLKQARLLLEIMLPVRWMISNISLRAHSRVLPSYRGSCKGTMMSPLVAYLEISILVDDVENWFDCQAPGKEKIWLILSDAKEL